MTSLKTKSIFSQLFKNKTWLSKIKEIPSQMNVILNQRQINCNIRNIEFKLWKEMRKIFFKEIFQIRIPLVFLPLASSVARMKMIPCCYHLIKFVLKYTQHKFYHCGHFKVLNSVSLNTLIIMCNNHHFYFQNVLSAHFFEK